MTKVAINTILFLMLNMAACSDAQEITMQSGGVEIKVMPEMGGRITSLTFQGRSLLNITSKEKHFQWGSTFWPGPQSSWNWPPPLAIDKEAYTLKKNDLSQLEMVSAKDPETGLQVTKEINLDEKENELKITYHMTNLADSAASWAPWEISRIPARGLCFFPVGDIDPWGEVAGIVYKHQGIAWVDLSDPMKTHRTGKIFSEASEGWLAYVQEGVVWLKLFEDIPSEMQAPGQGEIEVYYDFKQQFAELEQQGKYVSLSLKESVSWEVRWKFATIPANIDMAVGSEKLVRFVRSLSDSSDSE